ncbi:MAG: hypothetical protein MZV70_01440 [Desulfobacterales bacterium]|nr:hypothetical protein [Desulfobacterales bacterium]
MALNANPDGFELISEGDTDLVSLKLPRDILVALDCKEPIRSLFPMDYFSNMIRAIHLGPWCRSTSGTTCHSNLILRSQGKGRTKYLLAPRIEND